MPGHLLRARRPVGTSGQARVERDPDVIAAHIEDAAHFPGGHAAGIAAPASEADIAAILKAAPSVLAIGAQSSLTGGATPMGDVLISTARLNTIEFIDSHSIRVQAGVPLVHLDDALARQGRAYPPIPTFAGAFVGGVVATNAAGAATFKYGTTRQWVEALTIILPDGDVLDVERGATRAHPDGFFELDLTRGRVRVPVPSYRMPEVPKLSAGYYAAPGMDLIDLFVGAEGTLGIVTAVTLRVLAERPAVCLALIPFESEAGALACVRRLREASLATWRDADPCGIDVAAIEHMDRRSVALIRDDGADRAAGVTLPEHTATLLLVALDLRAGTTAATAFEEIGRAADPDAPDTALVRFCRLLGDAGVLEDVEIAVPGDSARAAQFTTLREAVPAGVNARVGRAKASGQHVTKMAADVIVPFDRIETLIDRWAAEVGARGLDAAVWGHISDGNLHPNVIPRSSADANAGMAAILACGRHAIALGGAPLAEHGVGRNRVKQQLLRELYGAEGIEAMRRVKRAIDPEWKMANGVIFDR